MHIYLMCIKWTDLYSVSLQSVYTWMFHWGGLYLDVSLGRITPGCFTGEDYTWMFHWGGLHLDVSLGRITSGCFTGEDYTWMFHWGGLHLDVSLQSLWLFHYAVF